MRSIRIHIDQALPENRELTLPEGPARHVSRVLRLGSGDAISLFNGDGFDYPSTLLQVERNSVRVRVGAPVKVATESPLQLILAQGIARGDKMDLVIQKATELGATGIVPLVTERSGVRLDAQRARKRTEHWQAVAIAACEQCGRARLPQVAPPTSLADWLQSTTDSSATCWALMPGNGQPVRNKSVQASSCVMLVVGPEGGLGDQDTRLLEAASFEPVNLGPRILRTETAGLAALAAIQAIHGDL